MTRLKELLSAWEEGTLTPEGAQQLKQLLANPEARAELVGDWLLHEAIYGKLQASQQESAAVARPQRSPRPAITRSPESARPQPDWLKRLVPRLVWREIHLSVRLSLGAALLLALACVGIYLHAVTAPIGRISERWGDVTLDHRGRTTPAQVGQWVFPRDTIRVPADGAAVLAWKKEPTQVVLEPGAVLQILGGWRGSQIALSAGRLRAAVAPRSPRHRFLIRSPEADATVVGTRFALETAAAATRLEVTEGAVLLRKMRAPGVPSNQAITVHPGQFAVASAHDEFKTQPITGCALYELRAFPIATQPLGTAAGSVAFTDLLTNLYLVGGLIQITGPQTNRFEHHVRCYLNPPATGDYFFWIHSGQPSQLWLGNDDSSASRKLIASMAAQGPAPANLPGRARTPAARPSRSGAAPPLSPRALATPSNDPQFNQRLTQKSTPQHLEQGRRYYLEFICAYDPNDYGVVGWTQPGQPATAPSEFLGGAVLTPYFPAAPTSTESHQP
jgi:hypothetical protein